jgi:hypothetical protein
MVAAGLIGAVAAPVSAAPSITPAEKVCKAQGGIDFGTDPNQNGAYICFAPLNSLSDNQLRTAKSLCERAFKGDFFFFQNTQSLPLGDFYGCGRQ